MEELNIYNIPAYKRKKSINQKINNHKKTERNLSNVSSRLKYRSTDEFSNIPITENTPSETDYSLQEEKSNTARTMKRCGTCEGYFEKIEVAILNLTSPLREGDRIILEMQDGLFEQQLSSIQINRKNVKIAKSGSEIGIKTLLPPIVGGSIYKINP